MVELSFDKNKGSVYSQKAACALTYFGVVDVKVQASHEDWADNPARQPFHSLHTLLHHENPEDKGASLSFIHFSQGM